MAGQASSGYPQAVVSGYLPVATGYVEYVTVNVSAQLEPALIDGPLQPGECNYTDNASSHGPVVLLARERGWGLRYTYVW